MSVLIVLPILIPMIAGIACVISWRSVLAQRVIAVVGSAALLGSGIALLAALLHPGMPSIAAVQSSGWAAPFGISFVADLFAAIMVLLNGLIGLTAVVFSLGSIDRKREGYGFHALVMFLLAACSGAFLTGDVFNLFVWFEIMLMSSFVLLALGSERSQLEGAIKYVTLNLISSVIFLSAVGVLYAMAGTLNMADLAVKLADAENPAAVTAVSLLFLTAFGIKAAVFPLFFWLPAAYHTCPPVVSALFAGLLTKVGVYAMIRTFMLIFTGEPFFTHQLLIFIAGFTMVTGVLGAATQGEIRRILSFHIISQIGYMVMGLGIAGISLARAAQIKPTQPEVASQLEAAALIAAAGTILYILHNIIAKTNLFYAAGIIHSLKGTGELKRIGGLYHARPVLSVCYLVSAMSLAGIPIFSGFWAKFSLVRAGLQAEAYWIVAISLAVSVLTMYSMTKIWMYAFWKPDPDLPEDDPHPDPAATRAAEGEPARLPIMYGPLIALSAITLLVGVFAGPCWYVLDRAGAQLIDRTSYVAAVLGEEAGNTIARRGNWGVPGDEPTRAPALTSAIDLEQEVRP